MAARSSTPPAHSGASARMGRLLRNQCRSSATPGPPASPHDGSRLAFVEPAVNGDIYQLGVDGVTRPIVRSSAFDMQPQYSPDGRRIALSSAGAGAAVKEVWLVDADGSNLTRLTRGPGRFQGYPGWSPDGSTVVFESKDETGTADIWTIKASGSGLRQVTRNAAEEILPSFSRNGRFIYFSSNRTGRYEVWRVATSGGPEEQVTRNGGVFPLESWDGRTVYYLRTFADGPLLGRPTAGGDEHTVLPCATPHGYAARSAWHLSLRLWPRSVTGLPASFRSGVTTRSPRRAARRRFHRWPEPGSRRQDARLRAWRSHVQPDDDRELPLSERHPFRVGVRSRGLSERHGTALAAVTVGTPLSDVRKTRSSVAS